MSGIHGVPNFSHQNVAGLHSADGTCSAHGTQRIQFDAAEDTVVINGRGTHANQNPPASQSSTYYASGGRKILLSLGLCAGAYGLALCAGAAAGAPILAGALAVGALATAVGAGVSNLWGIVNLCQGLFSK